MDLNSQPFSKELSLAALSPEDIEGFIREDGEWHRPVTSDRWVKRMFVSAQFHLANWHEWESGGWWSGWTISALDDPDLAIRREAALVALEDAVRRSREKGKLLLRRSGGKARRWFRVDKVRLVGKVGS